MLVSTSKMLFKKILKTIYPSITKKTYLILICLKGFIFSLQIYFKTKHPVRVFCYYPLKYLGFIFDSFFTLLFLSAKSSKVSFFITCFCFLLERFVYITLL